ncbi:MAG: sodium/proton-translocating pyrophosphatase, partial [Flavobacteriales bacterium]|nr:sodium/proton-translocating pyrophosphatase [Flavobacteriales bacterium]
EGTGKPDYAKCIDISTKASLKEMLLPGVLTIGFPIAVVLIGKLVYGDNNLMVAEMLGGYMVGVTVSGVLWAIFQNNAGGAWDNAKKSFEAGVMINGEMTYKGSEAHKAAVTGDTVGDPFKDTSGPSMNILIKLTCLIGLVIAPILGEHNSDAQAEAVETQAEEVLIEEAVVVEQGDFVKWIGRKVGGSHEGTIDLSETAIEVTETGITGSFTIDMNSILCTDMEGKSGDNLVGHLKDADFFNVDSFPTASFVIIASEAVEDEENYYQITGNLTIKGITNSIRFPAEVVKEDGKVAVKASFIFDRTDFNITYGGSFVNGIKDKALYDDVELAIDWKF